MVRLALIALTAGTVLFAAAVCVGQISSENRVRLQALGPDPFFGAPETLDKLVSDVPAAVLVEIVGPGDLRLEEVVVPHSTKRSVFGHATYRAIIRGVVYNRRVGSAPPLNLSSQVEFTQHVGRESAEAFLANRIPVARGDECLLFLWLWPHGWGMLNWHVQFCKSQRIPGAAEPLGAPRLMTFLGPKWLGASVPFRVDKAGVVMPDWESLVREVRRLSRQP